ncbi:GMC family oxidoreductase [Algiphilus sp.]|uniref:GMC family oxidoreductase n=1 Tax=Algiphilus sp. TaxID=1872431 RepID=UPI0025C36FC8|nr:GMC family oxidoreductase [Algiphilus sp.]MCK5769709.1 GMC family oxidoreductase [Algiphilus sp.]
MHEARGETRTAEQHRETAGNAHAGARAGIAASERYDYIVVGAGSAGCIVAARLAEGGAGTVLLIEAGDEAERHPETLSADGFKHTFTNDALMWHRMSAPQADCGGRSLYMGSGRVMGGSGAVNGMVYTRGDRRDFADWPAGWHWEDLVPAFEAVEARLRVRPRTPTAFAERFMAAAEEAGFARKDGLNDGDLAEVVGCNDMNYDGDARRSSYRAWLHEAGGAGVQRLTGAEVQRLAFDDRRRAIGVEVLVAGAVRRIAVTREVILCAGALETPRLLQLSGVGPSEELARLGIGTVLDAPGVGAHLRDHPNVCMFYRGEAPVDFRYPQIYAFGAARPGDGAAPDSCFVCYAAPASLKESMLRMIPILALPGRLYRQRWLRALLRALVHGAFRLPPLRRFVSKVFGVVVILGKPTSEGSVRLASRDPAVPARIDPAYYATESDRDTMDAAVMRAHAITRQAPLAGTGVRALSRAAVSTDRRKRRRWIHGATMTTFHYCGSCRMGEDCDSPVDTRLCVKGLANVRVADASVMPAIPVSALNAPSMMVGYRGADFILEGVAS